MDGLVNDIESHYYSVPLVVVTLLTAGSYFSSDAYPQDAVALVVLAVSVTVFCYLAYEFRRVAYLRGALTLIERRINRVTDRGLFEWNSRIVPKYVGNSWMNCLVPLSLALSFSVVDGMAFKHLCEGGANAPFVVALVVCITALIPSVVSLFCNAAVTKSVIRNQPVNHWRKHGFKWRVETKQDSCYRLGLPVI